MATLGMPKIEGERYPATIPVQIGLGGYVAGRSAEKITSQVVRVREGRDSEAKG